MINGLTLALALGFLILILWQNPRKEQNQFFALFLAFLIMWNMGSFLVQFGLIAVDIPEIILFALALTQFGFSGASVGIYVLTTTFIGIQSKRFRILAFLGLGVFAIYQIFLIISQGNNGRVTTTQAFGGQIPMLFVLFYFVFDGVTLFLAWRYRKKIASVGLLAGIVLFVIGQGFIFFNPQLIVASFSTSLGSIGGLTIAFSIIRKEIIEPLSERENQVQTMHRVSLAISSQVALDTLLNEIAGQTASLLEADGVGIFLKEPPTPDTTGVFMLRTAYELPKQYLGLEITPKKGLIGTIIATHKTLYLENYGRDWHGEDELPFARETFGAVIGVPLVYAGHVIGVLLVVSGKHGRVFDTQDIYVLELSSAQVAIVITHSHLFEEQKELDRLKSEMIRMASHDLKNPLMGAMTHMELLRMELDNPLTPEVKKTLETVEWQLERMNRIIRGILDVEKASLLGFEWDVCSPAQIIEDVLAELAHLIDNKKIRVESQIADVPNFRGDCKQFERAIINLVENAIKFTLVDGHIVVSVYLEGQDVMFKVADNGIGIPEEIQGRVFERFYRGQQEGVEHITGTGLGLSLVKTIVENHKGKVWFESKHHQGTTFYVRVPSIG
jgi:signal transduction histidine kinase